jgi:hypothetical protein
MKNFSVLGSAVLAATVLYGAGAYAAGWSNAVTISGVEADYISSTSKVYINFSSIANSNKPACASGDEALVAGSTDHVRNVLSLATAAFLAEKQVRVYWSGTCDGSSDIGVISHLKIQ